MAQTRWPCAQAPRCKAAPERAAAKVRGRFGPLTVSNTVDQQQDEPVGRGDLLTAEEVAALLRVTPAWVYAETRRHRIPHIRLGRYVRYRRDALAHWMDQLEGKPRTPRARVPIRSIETSADGRRDDRM